ncbi:MAG: ABC transporter ATP-binding protein [Phycisphaerales bacterium]|nr:ABC transporter ATP-binding protein [Phycisphaerales bacterium]
MPEPESRTTRPLVDCQGLTKVFKDFWMRNRVRAVDNVSFQIHPGEVFGLLGPNGSGKSTTIKMILGLLRPTKGRLAVFGKSPSDVNTKRRIGYLPEESYLYAFLNARETLEYYGKLFGLDRRIRESRIDELLEMVGLSAVQFRPVREYSKGMQRRIGIAQALINDPELLILDEPTTGLDPIGTRQIKDLIIELGRRGKTVLLSSHLLADVEDCVDRMVIYYGGRIREQGTCEQLLEAHDKTVLEFDRLDGDMISAIDRLVRERSGGERALNRAAQPRQRLEDLFIQMVEKARSERAGNSGAQHGGQTAAFLRAVPERETVGEAVIDRLVAAGSAEDLSRASEAPKPRVAPEDDALIGSLMNQPETPSAPSTPLGGGGAIEPDEPPADVDLGVIGSLLEVDQPRDSEGPGGRAGRGRTP